MQRTVEIDIAELNYWKDKLGWSNRLLGQRACVSERTIERLYKVCATSRATHAAIVDAISSEIIERGRAKGYDVKDISVPESLELKQVRSDNAESVTSSGERDVLVTIGVATALNELEITIDGDIEAFTPVRRDLILREIQNLLNSDNPPSVVRFRSGSIKMTIKVSPEQCETLTWAISRGDLHDLGVISAHVAKGQPATGKEQSNSDTRSESEAELRGRIGSVKGVRVIATGSYVPEKIVTNEDLEKLGCDSDWIVRRTGILQRHVAAPHQATSDLAYEAAMRCLDQADATIDDIDLIIVATMTPDYLTPSTACQLQQLLGAVAPAMDINAACAGFVYALTTAAQYLKAGNSKCALVVGADLMSRIVNPRDTKMYPLYGDAAGAVLLTNDEHTGDDSTASGILSFEFGSEGCGGELMCVPAGGTREALTPLAYADGRQYLTMDGRNVFKWAVRVLDESIQQVLQHAGVKASELELVVLHQANERIINSAVSDLCVPREKVFVNLDQYGNTSGASIPLALDEALKEGRVSRGDYVLLSGYGAGMAWGTVLLRW